MDSKAYITYCLQLPEKMKSLLQNDCMVENAIQLDSRHQLQEFQGKAVMTVERMVIAKELKPTDVFLRIKNELRLNDAKAKEVCCDFLGWLILPMEFYVGDVQSVIRSLGGDVEAYLREARKNFPEVYQPENAAAAKVALTSEHLLEHFDDRITTLGGKAELLLRLTGLSEEVEEKMKNEEIEESAGEMVLKDLDVISSAINTHDLNQLETESIKRKLKKVLTAFNQESL